MCTRFAVVMAAWRKVHGAEPIDQDLSLYYVANDIAHMRRHLNRAALNAYRRSVLLTLSSQSCYNSAHGTIPCCGSGHAAPGWQST